LEWWRVPAATGAPHITGPYVDYLCTDDYTLTLTVPVMYDGRMIGVAGADLYVNDIERTLLPHVRAIGSTATVVNASRRVVVSTDPHRPTGAILRPDDAAEQIACGQTSLVLVLG
ncbi:MAG TPA: cache domain-containing protein, partial [Rhodoglobus sp.]|nr:cache domain-containing protein [Rhodoglobus sp.]